jgi:hypothetical protein
VTHLERRAWTRMVAAAVSYTVYVVIILSRSGGHPLTRTSYAATLLWTLAISGVLSTVGETALGTAFRGPRVVDDRDRQIGRLGDYTGLTFVVIGAVAAMLMAMASWDRFWIANVIYLCFALSAVLGGITKVIAYRKPFPQW